MTKNARVAVRNRPARSAPLPAGRINPLRIERRAVPREAAFGTVAATFSGEGRYGITHLELIDRSSSGLGAMSRMPIEPGMVVTICPQGSKIPWLSGRVARCTPEGEQYRLGLVFDRRRAA
jgi:hypothetical protein